MAYGFEKREPHKERIIIDGCDMTDRFELLVLEIYSTCISWNGSMRPCMWSDGTYSAGSAITEFFDELKTKVCEHAIRQREAEKTKELKDAQKPVERLNEKKKK